MSPPAPKDELRRILRVAPHLEPADHPSGVLFLVGETEHHAVHAADVAAVIRALDGVADVEQVVNLCAAEMSPARSLQILARLEERRFVVPAADDARPGVEVVDATEGAEGGAFAAMAAALRAAGLDVGAKHGPLVIVAADYLAPACAALARAAHRAGRACFLVKPAGMRPFIGPYFTDLSGEACPDCLFHALREQRPVERWLQRDAVEGAWPTPPQPALPAAVAAAAGLAALRLRAILAGPDREATSARLLALDLATFALDEHHVRRRPQCATCGDPVLQATIGARPVVLRATPIVFSADGGYRVESPRDSYTRLRHLVSPILGPVTHLHPMPGRHTETHPVFSSGFLAMPAPHGPPAFHRACAGKGATVEQARMSALAEAVERHSALFRGDEAVIHATTEELGPSAIPPATLHLFHAAQAGAPPALPPDARIAWAPAWSLTAGERRYVPLAHCYADAPSSFGAAYCRPSSNGSAAGNRLEEAILQGLFELVERDAVAVWWYGRVRRPAARVPARVAAAFAAQRAAYEELGWSLWALDLTNDIGLPVIVAVATHAASDRLSLGFGCHADAGLAFSRALSEVQQVFDPHGTVRSPWDGMRASALAYLRPDPSAPAAPAAEAIPSTDLRDHVEACVARLATLGLETVVVDKTRPDTGLCVAQVIVPGLRHVWPRFAPGRLYTVPVALGWLPAPLTESCLNPQHLLI